MNAWLVTSLSPAERSPRLASGFFFAVARARLI
jgi:hypothetical protein